MLLRGRGSFLRCFSTLRILTLSASLLILLSACGRTTTEPAKNANVSDDFSLKIIVTDADTPESIEAKYGGHVVVWHPQAGFAIIGMQETDYQEMLGDDSIDKTTVSVEANDDAVKAPLAEASGFRAWSSGFRAWSSSYESESDGSLSLSDNDAIWQQIALPDGRAYAPANGQGVKIAIIDTGVDVNHPALKSHLAPENEWFDFVDNDSNPQEEDDSAHAYGHGTAVAGIVLQVAPGSTILPIRVLNTDGSGDITHVASAIDWAVAHQADIINLSLGTEEESSTIKAMVEYASKQGVYVTVASGNSGDTNIDYPAKSANTGPGHKFVMGVGSVNLTDVKSDFSTYGQTLELLAPGEGIHTTAPDNRLMSATGTSFAAPIVAGTLALALAEVPTEVSSDLDKELRKTLVDVEDVAGNEAFKGLLGDGRLQVEAFLSALLEGVDDGDDGDDEPEVSPNNAPIINAMPDQTISEGVSVNISINASDPDGDTLTYSATNLPAGLSINSSTGVISGSLESGLLGQSFDVEVTVTDDAKTPASASMTFKLMVDAFALSPYAGTVMLNEVRYKQSGFLIIDEFIEIYNAGTTDVDLTGWKLTDFNPVMDQVEELNASFPAETLGAGSYAVVWTVVNAILEPPFLNDGVTLEFQTNNPIPPLDNEGDDVWLLDADGRIVDFIAYGGADGHQLSTPPPASLQLWNSGYQFELGNVTAGQSISLAINGVDSNYGGCWEPTGSDDSKDVASQRCVGAKTTRNTDATGDVPNRISSAGKSNN